MKKNCNVCGKKIVHFLDLGNHPCADTFLSKQKDALKIKKYKLQAGYCACHHLSAVTNISGYERYNKLDYSYTSSNSPVSIEHFKNIARKISKKFINSNKDKVLEIASNDGTFLKQLKKLKKVDVLGIDPSNYMSKLAKEKGVNNETMYFNNKTSNIIKKKYGIFDLIYGANVFNHIDDPYDFLNGCKNILKKNGILILEFPDLDQLIKKISFDTIYHEHRNYYSKYSLIKIFSKINMKIIKFENLDYMSGSIRIFIKNCEFINLNIKKKNISRNIINFKIFKKKVEIIKKDLLKFLSYQKKQNKVIAGIGAATKGNTLLNYCKINYKDINCILETSVHKVGKFTPGSAIPIINENKKINFDVLLILPWNISKFLKNKIKNKWKVDIISLQDIVKKI